MTFEVKTEVFKGPLEVLLDLVESRKLLINDISLAKITDDFISHIRSFEKYPLAEASNFILISSILLLIKSKSLLPTLDLSEDEQSSIHDLELRLSIYKKFRDLSRHVKNLFNLNPIYLRGENNDEEVVFAPYKSLSLFSIEKSVRDLLQSLPKVVELPKAIVRKVISLEEVISNLTKRIKTHMKLSFRDFAKVAKGERIEIIVSFLAMLELVKQGVIRVKQEHISHDIVMETDEINVPNY